jgi:hypothetical protein
VESFVRQAAPIVIALVGLVVFWCIARMIINRKDNENDSTEKPKKDDRDAKS